MSGLESFSKESVEELFCRYCPPFLEVSQQSTLRRTNIKVPLRVLIAVLMEFAQRGSDLLNQ